MGGKQQHVDLHRKLQLRTQLLGRAASGSAYVPYCGDGDIAAELYFDRIVWAADIDEERVDRARQVIGNAGRVEVADVEAGWPFGVDLPPEAFAVADFDAYAYPYDAFRHFWADAPKADRLVLFFTDGQRQGVRRGGTSNSLRLPDGTKQALFGDKAQRSTQARDLFNLYWAKHIEPWFRSFMTAEGWTVVETSKFLRDSMLYWGAVVERGGKPAGRSVRSPSKSPGQKNRTAPGRRRYFDVQAREIVLAQIRAGDSVEAAAAAAGMTGRTVHKHAKNDPTFKAALDAALDERGPILPAEKFDDDLREEYLDKLRSGARRRMAARAVGVDPKTVNRYVHAHPDFEAEMRGAEAEANELVENALFMAATSGNVTAAQVWLYNRDPASWRDRRNVPTILGGDAGTRDSLPEDPPENWLADLLTSNPEADELLERLEMLATPAAEAAS